jgi:hypothetical protein
MPYQACLLWIPSLLFLVDFARHKRELYWAYILIALGPMGALAYLLYHYETITFPFPIARTFRELGRKPAEKTCPRCLRRVSHLQSVVDGRQSHYMCDACACELDGLGR